MFWKTCLTHAGEILLALGGAWILGYLWNRWFGSHSDPKQIAEYEDQIRTLRDRIKIQDQEIKAGLVRHDTWNSELTDLKESNIDLRNQLTALAGSYSQHISPADQKNIQAKSDYQLKLNQDEIVALSEEKDYLANALKSMEAEVKSLRQKDIELTQTQTTLNLIEDKLNHTERAFDDLQHQLTLMANQTEELKSQPNALTLSHNQELSTARQNMESLSLKNQELENSIHQLKTEQGNKDIKLQEAIKKLDETRLITKELENKYILQLESRDQEINELHLKLDQIGKSNVDSADSISKELSNSRQQLEILQNKLNEVSIAQPETKEMDPLHAQKIQDMQIQNQQLLNELELSKTEIQSLSNKLSNSSQLEKNIAELSIKSKEWEARWKDAATESEQFKVAHASLIKERDGQKQHLAQLEADILEFKSVFEEKETREDEWNKRQNDLKENMAAAQATYENNLKASQQNLDAAAKKLEDQHSIVQKLQADQQEWVKKYEALQQDFNSHQNQLTEADQVKKDQEGNLLEMEKKTPICHVLPGRKSK